MEEARAPQLSLIESLPIEIVREILSAIPDFTSLRKAVLSFPVFYNSYINVQLEINRKALINQLGDVFPEAVAAYESSVLKIGMRTEPLRTNMVYSFVQLRYSSREVPLLRTSPSVTFSWGDGVRIEKFYNIVDELAQRFVNEALASFPLDRSELPVTIQEMNRIRRSIYHFEVYCNLFKDLRTKALYWHRLRPVDPETQEMARQKMFLHNCFAPWEIEQIGCIHDFLYRIASPVFTDVRREHRIPVAGIRARQWGEWEVPDAAVFERYFTTIGVEKLYQLSNAEYFQDRYYILDDEEYGPDQQDSDYRLVWPSKLEMADTPPGDWESGPHRVFFADPDQGPMEVWKQAHIESRRLTVADSNLRLSLRQWGYVMWDRSRLDEINFLPGFWFQSDRDQGMEYRKKLHHERCYDIARRSDFHPCRTCGDNNRDDSSDEEEEEEEFYDEFGIGTGDSDEDDIDRSHYTDSEAFHSVAHRQMTGTTVGSSVRDASTQTHSRQDASTQTSG